MAPAPEPYDDYECFWVEREDGSRKDISYSKCINTDATPMIKFLCAAREAVKENYELFIEQVGSITYIVAAIRFYVSMPQKFITCSMATS